MSTETKIWLLAWVAIIVWCVLAAHLAWDALWLALTEALVGSALDGKTSALVLIRIAILVLIPIVYFFTVRRIQWKLPPEEYVSDRMNINNK